MIVFLLVALPMLAYVCYVLLPQAWRSIKGNDPFAPLDEDRDWNVRR